PALALPLTFPFTLASDGPETVIDLAVGAELHRLGLLVRLRQEEVVLAGEDVHLAIRREGAVVALEALRGRFRIVLVFFVVLLDLPLLHELLEALVAELQAELLQLLRGASEGRRADRCLAELDEG